MDYCRGCRLTVGSGASVAMLVGALVFGRFRQHQGGLNQTVLIDAVNNITVDFCVGDLEQTTLDQGGCFRLACFLPLVVCVAHLGLAFIDMRVNVADGKTNDDFFVVLHRRHQCLDDILSIFTGDTAIKQRGVSPSLTRGSKIPYKPEGCGLRNSQVALHVLFRNERVLS